MKIQIIAELAQGFEGKEQQALLLIKAAAAAGADAAKFQLVYADELATCDYKYYDLFKSLEMPDEVWKGLAEYAKKLGIELHLDIFGTTGLMLAQKIGITTIKLHGTDISNTGLLNEVAKSSVERVLLGAGGAYMNEIEHALKTLSSKKVTIILGFQGYPTPDATNQISRVKLLTEYFKDVHSEVQIGFADHASPDTPMRYALAATAVGAGAVLLEKHLTLGRIMEMEDFEAALNPDEFLEFTGVVRGCAAALGRSVLTENFDMSVEEQAYREMIRRHVVTARDLTAGTILTPSDLVLKRTSSTDAVKELQFIYNQLLKRDIKQNMPVMKNDL
jgi:sialic acid synthase SpsE